ncbi:MAG: AbrB/MazE/SpoVT family DNA-binding domain-containing protein [Clostridia bacterium]|nr:AbrB/MazE/SpoVT family DNA-binding domain-containing protein [Clostridia bacterium]
MAFTGIERRLDELGRVVIPKELRNSLNIPTGTPLAIYVEGSRIILEKSAGTCAICGSSENVKEFGGKGICEHCIEKIKSL